MSLPDSDFVSAARGPFPLSAQEATGVEPPPAIRWLNLILRHRRSLALSAFVGALCFVIPAIRKPISYTAVGSAVMDSRKPSSSLSGLSAQLGLSSIGADGAQSPQFYADLLTSRLVLGGVVDSTYEYQSDTGRVRGTLVTIFGIEGSQPAMRREAAITRLRRAVSTTVSPKTGVISIAATTGHAALAPLIVQHMIAEVNRVNILSRQSQAGGEREFTGRRMMEAASELRAAENALQSFMEENRASRSAPRTAMEEDRRARAVAMRQAIYTSVAQAYEQARIDEARDTPGLRVVEPAVAPLLRNPRGLRQAALLGIFAGLILRLAWIGWSLYLERSAQLEPGEFYDYRRNLRDTFADLVHPWRMFRRGRSGGPSQTS